MSKLGNPAVIGAVLESEAGKRAMNNAVVAQEKAISLGFTLLKIGIFALIGVIAYKKIVNGFKKQKQDTRYTPANISDTEASYRASELFKAMYGVGSNFNKVVANLQGVNYNGYIKIYNAFGSKRGADFKSMTLTQWFYDQFSESQIMQLKFITNNAI